MPDIGRRRLTSSRSNSNDRREEVIDLTGIGGGTSSTTTIVDKYGNSNIFCELCSVPLIEKKDDTAHLGYSKNRFICPRCGKIKDPLNLEDNMNNLKRGEKGQTIRSNNSSSSSVGGEGVPFAEVFSTNAADKKDSLRGTQLTRSLQQNISDPDGPNEEANLRSQNIRITKTTTEYPESKRLVTKIYDDDY